MKKCVLTWNFKSLRSPPSQLALAGNLQKPQTDKKGPKIDVFCGKSCLQFDPEIICFLYCFWSYFRLLFLFVLFFLVFYVDFNKCAWEYSFYTLFWASKHCWKVFFGGCGSQIFLIVVLFVFVF